MKERRKNKRIAVVTGASSGIGYTFARTLDQILHTTDEIWLIARNRERLTELSKQLRMKARIIPMDLTSSSDITSFEHLLQEELPSIRILINAAGLGFMGEFMDVEQRFQEETILCNCVGLTRMTRICLPYMAWNARIIQLASSAAFLPQPDFAVYAASKAYVLSLSTALGEELRERGIYVTSVCPGPVSTPFFDKAEVFGKRLAIKNYVMVTPEHVVLQALRDSKRRKRMSVCGVPMKAFYALTKLVPERFLLFCMRILKVAR